MLTLDKCPVCGFNEFEPFLVCKDYTVSKQDFSIVSCKACGFKFTNPRPADNQIGAYYKSEDYISHTNTKKGLVNKLYHMVRNITLKNKLKLVSSYVSRGTILDYGCGTGMFLGYCKSQGWETYGMEPDDEARKLAIEQGLSLFADKQTIDSHLPNKQFDAITLWHVLEHVTDLPETLSFFKKRLNPNGVLIIAVPNHASYDANYYKEHWAAYDVPRHIYHFDLNSVSKLLSSYGFTLQKSLPMKYDSFYVSMLSEKYKTGSANLIKAFWIGLMSNLKAKDMNHYSSTIYVFKHN